MVQFDLFLKILTSGADSPSKSLKRADNDSGHGSFPLNFLFLMKFFFERDFLYSFFIVA